MQQIDATVIETFGIPRVLLMDHAGLALARSVRALVTRAPKRSIVICCGTGFNGGDGLSAARHLHEWGYPLRVSVIGRLDQLRAEPATYATMLRRLGLPIVEGERVDALTQIEGWLAGCSLIVDALLGIGVRGAVREPFKQLIARMNRSGKPIVAADIPSGLDGDTGLPQGIAVKATRTVTFGAPKRGCLVGQGPAHTGELVVESITIPRRVLERCA